MFRADAPRLAVERIGMPQIVHVGMDYAGVRIGLDQGLGALASFPEEPAIGSTVFGHTDMTPGHAGIDAISVFPIGGDVPFPITRFVFNCPERAWHLFRSW
jgi:hypothetical protein